MVMMLVRTLVQLIVIRSNDTDAAAAQPMQMRMRRMMRRMRPVRAVRSVRVSVMRMPMQTASAAAAANADELVWRMRLMQAAVPTARLLRLRLRRCLMAIAGGWRTVREARATRIDVAGLLLLLLAAAASVRRQDGVTL